MFRREEKTEQDGISNKFPSEKNERKDNDKKSKQKSSKGRTEKSKAKTGLQRSLSMFDLNTQKQWGEEDDRIKSLSKKKEEKKKDKFDRSSLRRKKKHSTPSSPTISIDTGDRVFNELSVNDDKMTKGKSLEVPDAQLRGKKNTDCESIFKRLSWRRSDTNLPLLEDEPVSLNNATNSDIYDDFSHTDPRSSTDSSDSTTFGSQSSISYTEPTQASPEKNQPSGTTLKAHQNETEYFDTLPPTSSYSPTLSKNGSLSTLDGSDIIENDVSPHQKFFNMASPWNSDLSNHEEESELCQKEKERGIRDKLFDFKVDKVRKQQLTSTSNENGTSSSPNPIFTNKPANSNKTNNNMTNDGNKDNHHVKSNKNHESNRTASQASTKQKYNKRNVFARKFIADPNKSILYDAIKNSHRDALQKLLQEPKNQSEINRSKPPGVTVFHQACVFGDVKIVQMLLSNGADVNLKTWSKLSPVKIAVLFGHFDAAKLLLESGADSTDIINGYHEEQTSDPQ